MNDADRMGITKAVFRFQRIHDFGQLPLEKRMELMEKPEHFNLLIDIDKQQL